MRFAADLPPQDETGLCAGARLLQGGAVFLLHCHAHRADIGGRFKQVVTGTQIFVSAGLAANLLIQIPLDMVHHCLGGSEIASS